MTAVRVLFPTAGDVIAAAVIVAFWLTLAYFAITEDREDDGE